MKLKLPRPRLKEDGNKTDNSVSVRPLRDKAQILDYLEGDRGYSATAIAHLEPDFIRISRWFLASNEKNFALCLISKSMSPTYLFTLGHPAMLDHLLSAIRLPGEIFLSCQPQHLDVIDGYYEIGWHAISKRMMAKREDFCPAPEEGVLRMKPAHIKELNVLYKVHGNQPFSADQLRRGIYYGIWRQERLVAVAGTHIIATTYGIAYVGNVLTHSAYRNQGLASACTSAVTSELFDYCTEVVLNVEPHNLPAIRAYASLGYKDDCMIVEAFGHRRRFAGAIINHLWEKLGLKEKYEEGIQVDG